MRRVSLQVAAADTQLTVHDRRVVEHEVAVTRWRAALADQLERLLGDGFGQMFRIGDRRGTADELWLRTVEFADPLQAADHIGQVTPIHATIEVQLIDDEILQVLEQLHPFRVVREDPVCSMSGFVNTMLARSRMVRRASEGVSPS